MIINFRQGIVSTQLTPNFLTFVGGDVNINADSDPTTITFAHGDNDYLFSESETIIGAWKGPFSVTNNYWLYWDIDIYSGLRTFGFTTVNPFSPTGGYGILPNNPSFDQHFFEMSSKKMKVWNGNKWIDKIRVFAAKISSGSILQPLNIGSQINLNQQRNAGYLLFDQKGNVVKTSDRMGRGSFITTESALNSQDDRNNSYNLEALQKVGKAIEPLPKYHCLAWKGPSLLGISSFGDIDYQCIGISSKDTGINEVTVFITDGFINNFNNWNFTEPSGTSLWVGLNGEITTSVPQRYSMQKIGHIVSPDTIFVKIEEQILIDQLDFSTPIVSLTPTNTVTNTPTPTVTANITPTPTPTLPPTPTVTPSISMTQSITPTITITPTVTLTVTPTVTPTISFTPSITTSLTPTPTVTPTISFTPTVTITPTEL